MTSRLDARLLHACARWRRPRLDRAVALYSRLGNYGELWIGLGAALSGTRESWRPVLEASPVVLGTLVLNGGLKRLIGRTRPADATLPPPLIQAPASTSFPSSHAAMSAAGAVVLTVLSPPLGLIVVPAALAMAATRVYLAVHYPSDVAAGLAFGLVAGSALTLGVSAL